MTEGFSLEHLDVVRFYLFGDVKLLTSAARIGCHRCDHGGIQGNTNHNLWSDTYEMVKKRIPIFIR